MHRRERTQASKDTKCVFQSGFHSFRLVLGVKGRQYYVHKYKSGIRVTELIGSDRRHKTLPLKVDISHFTVSLSFKN
jgi:hypothetical protein